MQFLLLARILNLYKRVQDKIAKELLTSRKQLFAAGVTQAESGKRTNKAVGMVQLILR
jgi:hypothetical protein